MAAGVVVIVAVVSGGRAVAQGQAHTRAEGAVRATLAAFAQHSIVALGMSHWQQDEADFSLRLVRDPEFPSKVNDIVVECGNPLYQDVLDRYVAGETVALATLQLSWRNTTQPGRCDPRQHKELLDAVREVNQHLPAERRVRVLAGDSPVDWGRVRTREDLKPFETRRDSDFATVVETQVLARRRKALLIIGAAHILHHPISWRHASMPPAPTVTMIVETRHPGSTFVIVPHDGFGSRLAEFEARFAAWPKPSLVALHDTWLGAVAGGLVFGQNIRRVGSPPNEIDDPYPGLRLEDLADAFLYLGPLSSIARVQWPEISDVEYVRELERRHRLMREIAAPAPRPDAQATSSVPARHARRVDPLLAIRTD